MTPVRGGAGGFRAAHVPGGARMPRSRLGAVWWSRSRPTRAA